MTVRQRILYAIFAVVGITPAFANPYVMPSDYGAVCDGVTPEAIQLQDMINAGKPIFLPAGCVTDATLTLIDGTNITGSDASSIRITTGAPVFTANNLTRLSLTNFECKGSRAVTSWSVSAIGCLLFVQDSLATGPAKLINIDGMKFSNFNATYWNLFAFSGSIYPAQHLNFSNNQILTASADIPADPVNTNNSNFGITIYSGSGGNGRIENLTIKNNRVEATAMCFPIVLFGNFYNWQITGNTVLNTGNTSPSHCANGLGVTNAYGIMVYDTNADGHPPYAGLISGNIISKPYATGIYMVGDGYTTHNALVYNSIQTIVSDNFCEGQISSEDFTLPRGCIVVSLFSDVDITGNRATGGFGGYAVVGQMSGTVNVLNNSCFTSRIDFVSLPSCLRIAMPSVASTARIVVKGNTFETTNTSGDAGHGIRASSSSVGRFYDLEVSDNTILAGRMGFNFINQFSSGPLVFKNNRFGGVASNFMLNTSGLTGGPLTLIGNHCQRQGSSPVSC